MNCLEVYLVRLKYPYKKLASINRKLKRYSECFMGETPLYMYRF